MRPNVVHLEITCREAFFFINSMFYLGRDTLVTVINSLSQPLTLSQLIQH